MLERNTRALLKVEGTYGVDPSPVVGDDAVQITPPQLNMDPTLLERAILSGSVSKTQPIVGRLLAEASFQMEMKSQDAILDGVDSNPLEIDALLRMAGFDPTYTVETAPPASNDGYCTYAPTSTFESATFYAYLANAVLHKITGAYANLSFEFVAGNYPVINADLKGIYNAPTDAAAGALTVPSDLPVQTQSLSLAFGAVTGLVIPNFTINLNNEIVEVEDVNSANGLLGRDMVGRNPTISFRIRKELIATWDIYAALAAGTTYSTTFTQGSSAGDKILVTVPKLVLTNVTESVEAGVLMYDVEAMCAKNSDAGDDELTFKFF